MTQAGSVYGEALYQLAKDESLVDTIGQELAALQESFSSEPDFIRLLGTPSLTKTQRCQILDDSFRGHVHPYTLNFLKILTEKGYMRHFTHCADAFQSLSDEDAGILRVKAISAVALSDPQTNKLLDTLSRITGKQVRLQVQIDPAILGGLRLDYSGQRLDDTVSHRLDTLRKLLTQP